MRWSKKADGSTVVYAAVEQQNSGKKQLLCSDRIPVTTGLETDFYIEISGGEVTPGMAVISNPQSVTPGMEGHPGLCCQRHNPADSRTFLIRVGGERPMAKTIIDMKGIVKKFYIGQPNELTILKGIDLTVEEGGVPLHRRSVRFGQIHPDEHHRCAGPPDRRGISAG